MNHPVREIKCLVWDLDNTVWNGILLEGDTVELRTGVRDTIHELDGRGILQSIASRNSFDAAMRKLDEFEIDGFFLYPQITWGPKSASVAEIAGLLNVATDAIALIDDDPFERDEVAAGVKDVLCIDATALPSLLDMPEFHPRFITADSKRRRSMYQAEVTRRKVEAMTPANEFLASLGMALTISEAGEGDLERLEELTVRTHQLNSTGYVYSHEELNLFRHSDRHTLLVAGLDDSYGTYGKIGMALVEFAPECCMLKLLLMSCRVMSRGVGQILLSHVLRVAKERGKPVEADFVRTERNRMMYMTFKLAGFREVGRNGDLATLRHDLSKIVPYPEHVEVRVLHQ